MSKFTLKYGIVYNVVNYIRYNSTFKYGILRKKLFYRTNNKLLNKVFKTKSLGKLVTLDVSKY